MFLFSTESNINVIGGPNYNFLRLESFFMLKCAAGWLPPYQRAQYLPDIADLVGNLNDTGPAVPLKGEE